MEILKYIFLEFGPFLKVVPYAAAPVVVFTWLDPLFRALVT